jgi:hypothetical protein
MNPSNQEGVKNSRFHHPTYGRNELSSKKILQWKIFLQLAGVKCRSFTPKEYALKY